MPAQHYRGQDVVSPLGHRHDVALDGLWPEGVEHLNNGVENRCGPCAFGIQRQRLLR